MFARRLCQSHRDGSRAEKGAVAVEFALILPILLILVFGLIQYGLYFWSMQGGSSAAREAARRAAVGNPATCPELSAYIADRLENIATTTPAVTKVYKKGLTEIEFTPSAGTPVEVGDVVSVTVQFESHDMNFPFVPFIDDGVIKQTADSRVEYVPVQPTRCTT